MNIVSKKNLEKQINLALPHKKYLYAYNQVRAYFVKADQVLTVIDDSAEQCEADSTIRLIDYTLNRLCLALETVDDSAGYREDLVVGLQARHIEIFSKLNWSASKKAKYLCDSIQRQYCDFLPEIPMGFVSGLGKSGTEKFYCYIRKTWEELPPLRAHVSWEEKWRYRRIQNILTQIELKANNSDNLIKLYEKTAIDFFDIVNLTKLCLDNHKLAKAEFWLHRLQKEKGSRNYLSVVKLEVEYYSQKGAYHNACERQLWIYYDTLSIKAYQHLSQLAEKIKQKEKYENRIKNWLLDNLDASENSACTPIFTNGLLQIYLHKNQLSEAVALVSDRTASPDLLMQLARKAQNCPYSAMPIYTRLANFHIERRNNPGYEDAVEILKECKATMVNAAHDRAFGDQVEALRTKHKAKKNLIKYLREAGL